MTSATHHQEKSISSTFAAALLEHKKIIALCVITAIVLAFFYTAKMKTTYIATAKVMMNEPLFKTTGLGAPDWPSQIQIMQSPDVVRQLVINEELYRDPEFGGSMDFNNFDDIKSSRQQTIIATIKTNLDIYPVPNTPIVNITYQSSDRVKSTKIANALGDAYTQSENIKNNKAVADGTKWISDRLDVLRQDIGKAEMALQTLRTENNLTAQQSDDYRLIKIDLLNKKLPKIQDEYSETKAIIALIESAQKNNKRLDAIPHFLAGRLAENLKIAEADLFRKKAVLEKRYGPKHPTMIALQAELGAFKDQLNQEIKVFEESLRNQIKIHDYQMKGIEAQIDNLTASYNKDLNKRTTMKTLEVELETSRALLNDFKSSYLDSLKLMNVNPNMVRVITPATVASQMVVPNKKLVIILSAITGLCLGMFIALIVARFQNNIQSAGHIERLLGLPVYAVLPKVKLSKDANAVGYILNNPASILTELMRSLFVSLQLREPHKKSGGRVITMTSTTMNEGKTTTAIWLATVAVQMGKSVLIIDTDMRCPSLHQSYGIGNARGLVDYLSNRLPLDDTIYKKHASNVHVMTSKAIPTHAITLLGSERMETLLRRVRDMYDVVILDCSASLVFSDSRVMANLSDKTLYVVEWNKTTRDVLVETVKPFTDVNDANISFILNKVDNKKLISLGKDEIEHTNQ